VATQPVRGVAEDVRLAANLDVKVGELFRYRRADAEAHAAPIRARSPTISATSRTSSPQHICNFSVFQSLLDHWALGALFPIVPIHRLNERPAADSTLADITCDSDGKVNKFIDLSDVKDTIPLHRIKGDVPYYLGIFLTGAYQDIMGDIHNLFGRVNEVHVFLDDDEESGYYIEETIAGTDPEVLDDGTTRTTCPSVEGAGDRAPA
jgi:arginine decarboxylase-like protein